MIPCEFEMEKLAGVRTPASGVDQERFIMRHREWHGRQRNGWLRAAVLGANDGIVSTASRVVGVAAAGNWNRCNPKRPVTQARERLTLCEESVAVRPNCSSSCFRQLALQVREPRRLPVNAALKRWRHSLLGGRVDKGDRCVLVKLKNCL